MIVGIGTDLVEIERIGKALEKTPGFLNKIYGETERNWLASKPHPAASAAANFAGKEAVLKVFGTGLRNCRLCEIEILRDGLGKPYVQLSGQAKKLAQSLDIGEIQISLSHTKDLASAYAIGIRREKNHVISE